MSVTVTLNGTNYDIPEPGDSGWGQELTDYFVAEATGLLQKAGGTFTLTAEVDFGATYGVKSAYLKSRASNVATTGPVRLAVTDLIYWRNNANDGNLGLGINGSNKLTFNGTAIEVAGITALTGDVTATGPGSAAATIAAIQGVTVSGTTGTGNVVFSASPTVTGTLAAAAGTFSSTLGVTGNFAVNTNKFTVAASSGNTLVAGTLDVTGVATLTAQPILSSLTASQAVFTDGSKGLVSNAITGSGNVVMSTSPTLVTPNLGTPSTLVGTNITGTAAGLTAGNVTTNANLTGPITSVGNATSIASQTGTGTTFVMSAGPTITGTLTAATITASSTVTGLTFVPTGSSAPTNGLFLPTTNTVGLATNSTERLRIDSAGRVGVIGVNTNSQFSVSGTSTLSGTTQRSIHTAFTATSAATTAVQGFYAAITGAASTTHTAVANFLSDPPTAGASGAITRFVDFRANGAAGAVGGTGNAAFADNSSFSGNWFINQSSTNPNLFLGNVQVGDSTTDSTATNAIKIANGTAATGVADNVILQSVDLSAGNTILALRTEGSGVVSSNSGTTNLANRIAIKVNGTVYYLLAASSA